MRAGAADLPHPRPPPSPPRRPRPPPPAPPGWRGGTLGRAHVPPPSRPFAACRVSGMAPADILITSYAKAGDPSSGGHQMPAHYSRPDLNIYTTSSSVATQITHAAGVALAARLKGEQSVTVTY